MKEKLERLNETIALIDRNLGSNSLYESDRLEIERSREFFEGQKEEVRRQMGVSSVRSVSELRAI